MTREKAIEIFETHFNNANELTINGNIDEAINEYLICKTLVNKTYVIEFTGIRNIYNKRVNYSLLPLYELKENYSEALVIINQIIKEEPTKDYYLKRANIYRLLNLSEMSELDINVSNRLDRVYFVSVLGSDTQNNGLTEESPFQTLEKAVDAAKRGAIKTIIIIGTLSNEEHFSSGSGSAFSVDNNGNEILIIGKSNGVLTAKTITYREYFYHTVVRVSGNFRFSNIRIGDGNTGLEISSNSNIFLDNGVEISGNNYYRNSDYFSQPRSSGINNSGNLVIQGDAIISSNYTTNRGNAGGITNSGSLLIKNFVIISENKASQISNNRRVVVSEGACGGIYNSGSLTIQNSVKIINNASVSNAGGIYNSGTINMLGGEIRNNFSEKNGGGIYNIGTFNMRNGLISNNGAEYGGGIYISGGSNSVFTLFNGTIENNQAKLTGGGVYVESRGRFNQNSGEIRNNTASDGNNNVFRQ
jgi:hypothetical protein